MTNDPILEHVIIDTKSSRFDSLKASFSKHKTTIVLGAALAASLALNVVLLKRPEHTCQFELTSDDIAQLNELLELERSEIE